MATIVTREVGATAKGSPLSNAEIDQNFINLNTEVDPVLSYPSIAPSLLLDFANTKRLDPRVTFTRSTTAVYYDGVTTAMAEQNLILYSQDFAQAPYYSVSAGSSKVSTTATAPNGTATALEASFTTQYDNINIPSSVAPFNGPLKNSTTYTLSYWARRDSGTNTLSVYTGSGFSLGTYTPNATWTRYSFTFTWTYGTTGLFVVQDRNASGFTNVQIWGVQLEERSSATAYTQTTGTAITNYIPQLLTAAANVPRFDCNPTTGESLGLLIEEQRTNSWIRSEQFEAFAAPAYNTGDAWETSMAAVSTNTAISPNGGLNADAVLADATNGNHLIRRKITLTDNRGVSFYVKSAGAIKIDIYDTNIDKEFVLDLTTGQTSAGVVVGKAFPSNYGAVNVGNGWFRVYCFSNAGATNNNPITIYISNSTGSFSYTGNGFSGIYLWGAQLEVGTFPTSYIPTVASTVTRNADAASMAGTAFSSWYNAAEGTMYFDGFVREDGSVSFYTTLLSAAAGNTIATQIGFVASSSGAQLLAQAGASSVNIGSLSSTPTAMKLAMGYAPNSLAGSKDGGAAVTTGTVTLPGGVDRLFIGGAVGASGSPASINGTIKKIAYYPIRLSNTQLQAITG